MYKQSLKANNKSLTKALDVAKREIALVIQRHTELVKLNQDQAATISVLKRMADTSSEAIEKQVQERMAMKLERMRSRLDLAVSHVRPALDSLLDTILLCDGQSTHDLDQAVKDTLEMTSRQTPAFNSRAVGGKPSRVEITPLRSTVIPATSPVVSAPPSLALPSTAHKEPEAVADEPAATAAPTKPSKRQSAASKRQTARKTVDAELSVPADTESYVKAEPKQPARKMEIILKRGQISVAVGSRDGGPATRTRKTTRKKAKKAPSKQAATSVSDKTSSVSGPLDPFDLSFPDTFCAELPTAPTNRLKASHKPDATTPQDELSPPPAKHPAQRGRPARSHAKTDNHLADASSPGSPVVSGQTRKKKRRLAAEDDACYFSLRCLDSPSLSESAASPALHLSEEEGDGRKPDLVEPVSTRADSHESDLGGKKKK